MNDGAALRLSANRAASHYYCARTVPTSYLETGKNIGSYCALPAGRGLQPSLACSHDGRFHRRCRIFLHAVSAVRSCAIKRAVCRFDQTGRFHTANLRLVLNSEAGQCLRCE